MRTNDSDQFLFGNQPGMSPELLAVFKQHHSRNASDLVGCGK